MDNVKIVRSLSDFLATIRDPAFLLGLYGRPAAPWRTGSPDTGFGLLPSFFKSGVDARLERELLREFKQTAVEFAPARGPDADVTLLAHASGLPGRMLEWMANPLAALFPAVESMKAEYHGLIWILDPWEMNRITSKPACAPLTDTDCFARFVNLTDPEAPEKPAAEFSMAFRPFRTSRASNMHNIHYTAHGRSPAPINEPKDSARFVTFFLIDGESRKRIMKELHDVGATRANLFAGLASLTKTLAYRYTGAYLKD
jgi:hypothetical protein